MLGLGPTLSLSSSSRDPHMVSCFLTLLHVRGAGLTAFTITATVHILHSLVLQQGARTYLQTHDPEGGREGGREGEREGSNCTPSQSADTPDLSSPSPPPTWSVPRLSAFVKRSTRPFSYLGSPIVAERDAAGGCARNRDGRDYRALNSMHFRAQLLAVERECEGIPSEVQEYFDTTTCLNVGTCKVCHLAVVHLPTHPHAHMHTCTKTHIIDVSLHTSITLPLMSALRHDVHPLRLFTSTSNPKSNSPNCRNQTPHPASVNLYISLHARTLTPSLESAQLLAQSPGHTEPTSD
jgi:hypothetical protein